MAQVQTLMIESVCIVFLNRDMLSTIQLALLPVTFPLLESVAIVAKSPLLEPSE
jgi:hypothetical protein